MRVAIYLLDVGEDFIEESILSVIEEVDHVYVFWGALPRVEDEKLIEGILCPAHMDRAVDRVRALCTRTMVRNRYPGKLHLIQLYETPPMGRILINSELRMWLCHMLPFMPEEAVFLAPWHVASPGAITEAFSGTSPATVALWRPMGAIDPRAIAPIPNPPPVFSNPLCLQDVPAVTVPGSPRVYDLEFCQSDRSMYWSILVDKSRGARRGPLEFQDWSMSGGLDGVRIRESDVNLVGVRGSSLPENVADALDRSRGRHCLSLR